MIRVQIPRGFEPERTYAVEVVFRDLLGVDVEVIATDRADVRVHAADDDAELLVDDVFFRENAAHWLQESSVPVALPAPWADAPKHVAEVLSGASLPVLFATPGSVLEGSGRSLRLRLDVFGSVFFLLTRYEERALPHRDEHGRFPASASLATREGFLERPLADEYAEALFAILQGLWPGLAHRRRARRYRLRLSHDVDNPYLFPGPSPLFAAKVIGHALLVQRSLRKAARAALTYPLAALGDRRTDPFDTFAFLMDRSERAGQKSAFYFLAGRTSPRRDGTYDIDQRSIVELLRAIGRRGHEVGLHPSYGTYRDAARTRGEFQALRDACERAGVRQSEFGGRQHYLRWENPTTWRNWEAAGLAYDSTLSFAQAPGFRAGTCREYTAFDLEERRPLRLRERPLVVMEGTLLDAHYMHLSLPDAGQRILDFARVVKRYRGDFTLLWHNSSLETDALRDLYGMLVPEIS